MEIITVPTGKIIIIDGKFGKLECLSLSDYGKDKNIKADFLGLTKDIDGVPCGDTMPLSEKWVITISTQYGCSQNCKFCDVPKVGSGINATRSDLLRQIISSILVQKINKTKRLNIHYARMGEPTFNDEVTFYTAYWLKDTIKELVEAETIHPVVSTMMPKHNNNLLRFIENWCTIKNKIYSGEAGLQLSINSTNDTQREYMFSGNSLKLKEISEIGLHLPKPIGRKYTLNFALADNFEIDAKKLVSLFNPQNFMVKITPIHNTTACNKNKIKTTNGYKYFTPYKDIEQSLKNVGFDVIVFVPSNDEETSKITCGNAILSQKTVI